MGCLLVGALLLSCSQEEPLASEQEDAPVRFDKFLVGQSRGGAAARAEQTRRAPYKRFGRLSAKIDNPYARCYNLKIAAHTLSTQTDTALRPF